MKDSVIYLTSTTPITKFEKAFTKNKDVDIVILTKLSYKDLLETCKVNKYVENLCKSDILWRNKLIQDFPLRSKFLSYPKYKDLYVKNPRQLYELILKPSKIVTITADQFPDIEEIISDEDDLDPTEELEGKLERVNKIISSHLDTLPLLRGDVIFMEWIGDYRNDGKLIWDGEKVLAPAYDVDEYGSVPKEFTFPEFPLNHFHTSIVHNYIMWLSPQAIKEVINNFNVDTQRSFITDNNGSHLVEAKDEDEMIGHINKEEFAVFIHKNPFVDNFEGEIYGIANYFRR